MNKYMGFYTPQVKSCPEPIWKRNKVSIFSTARDRTTADLSDTYAPPAEHIPPLSLAQALIMSSEISVEDAVAFQGFPDSFM